MENKVEITENPTLSCMGGNSSTDPTQLTQENHQETTEAPCMVELGLDLSLNGRFGVNPTAKDSEPVASNPSVGTLNAPPGPARGANSSLMRRAQPDPMPYVFAEGTNGRRVYGFVYRYTDPGFKILCVCHGVFLTPGQFVEHAGGGVVEHPLRHIMVTRFPYSMN